jgi:hypothetical protein
MLTIKKIIVIIIYIKNKKECKMVEPFFWLFIGAVFLGIPLGSIALTLDEND